MRICSTLLAASVITLGGAAASAQQYTTCSLANANGATSLAEGSATTGSTVGATASTFTGNCASVITASPAVWFRFVPSHSGDVTFDTCGSNFDTVLSVHTGCTGTNTGATQRCNDNAPGCSPASSVTLFVTAGYPYLIRVGGVNGSAGNFTLNIGAVLYKTVGPDVAVWAISDVARYAPTAAYESRAFFDPVSGAYTTANIESLAVGTTSTNYGDLQVDWRDSNAPSGGVGNYSNQSPAIAQNIFKYQPVAGQSYGRFRQLGQGWLKVGFTSTNSSGGPGTCVQTPLGSDQLGINCLDTYSSGLNGNQTYLAPRSSVHVSSGYYTPWRNGQGTSGSYLFKRVEFPSSEYVPNWGGSPSTYTNTSRFYSEGYYVAYEDALWGNGRNNMSWHEILVTSAATSPAKASGNSHRLEPAIKAWGAVEPGVTYANAEHTYQVISAGDHGPVSPSTSLLPYVGDTRSNFPPTWPRDIACRYVVASKATDIGNGRWHYEFAIYNINSDRSGGSFSMRLPAGAEVSNVGQSFPMCHSGEPYSNQYVALAAGVTPDASNTPNGAWSWDASAGLLKFSADGTYASKVNANAMRWGTLYNYWFDCNVPPVSGWTRIGLFKPTYDGSDPSVNSPPGRVARDLAINAYASGISVPRFCPPDVVGLGGTPGPDGQVTVDDLTAYLTMYFASDLGADMASLGGSAVPDDLLTPDDLVYFISAFFAACP